MFVTFFVSLIIVGFSLPQMVYAFKETGELRREQIIPVKTATTYLRIKETGLDDYNVTAITLRPYDGKDIKVAERFQSQRALPEGGCRECWHGRVRHRCCR